MDCMDPRQGVHNKGSRLDSTPQSWPPIAPKDHGAERTRGRCLGRTEEPVGIHGAVPCHLVQTAHCRPQCCQKHDVVVKLSLPSVCWQEEPPATQETCRLVAEAQGASRGKLPKTSAFRLLPSALCPLLSVFCSLPSALSPQPSALTQVLFHRRSFGALRGRWWPLSDVLKAKRAPEPPFGIVRETLRGAAALLSRHTLSHALCVGIVPQRWQTNNRGRLLLLRPAKRG
ncbi:hypothetical protein BGZ57DRAFT_853652 [Hyaloscypha finlandica]|nr:hypothetical protein BGZ57DRAFT_853652 [Hyaloscypha finlandica]